MPPERLPPDDPREWLNRARSSLVRSRANLAGVYREDLCFNAQQAAEKAIKAVLIARGVRFRLVHDLAYLSALLEQGGQTVPPDVADVTDLARFAVITRYPGVTEPATTEEHERAVATTEAVVRCAEGQIAETLH